MLGQELTSELNGLMSDLHQILDEKELEKLYLLFYKHKTMKHSNINRIKRVWIDNVCVDVNNLLLVVSSYIPSPPFQVFTSTNGYLLLKYDNRNYSVISFYQLLNLTTLFVGNATSIACSLHDFLRYVQFE